MKASLALPAGLALLLTGCGTSSRTVAPGLDSMGGLYAQDVTALLVPGESAPALFAGTRNGDMYTSSRTDSAWEKLSTIREGSAIHRIVRDPENPVKLYAATEAGLYSSADGGASWTEIPLIAGRTEPVGSWALAIDPWDARVMYVGTKQRGILRSGDEGVTWSPANQGIPGFDSVDVYEIVVDMSRPDHLLAAVSALGVVQSSDAGKTWSRLTEEFSATGSTVTHLVQSRQTPTTLVYGTDAGSIRKSIDGGMTWTTTRNGSAEGTILSLLTYPGHPEALLVGTESGILLSRDLGTSWADISGILPHIPVTAAASPDGRTLFAFGEGIGLQRTADGGATWIRADAGLGGATVRLVTTDEKGERVYAALEHGVLAFDPATASWQPASSGLTGGTITSIIVDSDSSLHLFAATSLGGFQSRDGGRSWQFTTRNLRIVPKILEAHPRIHTRMLASGELGVYVSTDKGDTWLESKPFASRYEITAFTFAPTNTGTIYGATPHAAVVSRDGGFVWDTSRHGLPAEEIIAITVDNKDPSMIYAWTSSGGSYRSMDAGLEWNMYAPPWKQHDRVLIAFDRYEPFSVVALINGRDIYYSPTGGGTWFSLFSVDLKMQVHSLWWNAPSATLYAGLKAKGVRRLPLGQKLREILEK